MTTPKTFLYPEYYIQEDWGLVTQSSTESIDLGLTSSPATENEDFGLILTTQQELNTYQDQRQFIFDLDNLEERATYNYNDRAILLAREPDNYGSIADPVDDAIDYGYIADSQTEAEDYRYIYYGSDVYPYGTVELSGEALSTFITLAIHFGSGSAELSGTKIEKNTFSEVGSGSGVISGIKGEKSIFSEIGSGTLSAITGASEATGVNPPDSTVLFEISGTTDQSSAFREIGSGTAEFSGTKVEKNTFREIGSGSFSAITGAAEVAGVNPPDQTLLFEISGTKVEKKTYSYNERSILPAQSPDNYGLITDSPTESIDYGSITDSELESVSDYRYIYNTEDVYPYGTIEVSGSARFEFITQFVHVASGSVEFSGTKIEKNTFREIGSGSFSAFSGSAEVVGVNPPDQTLLFEISGTKVEKNTYSYNEKSIFIFDGIDDYGLVSDAIDETIEDYGLVSNSIDDGISDYGTISSPYNETTYPYGTIEVSGFASNEKSIYNHISPTVPIDLSGTKVEKNTFREIGSGSLSAISGSAESTLVNPPDQILLFEISGTKVEKKTFVYSEKSIFIFDGYEDHGVITVVQDYDDYGLLTDSVAYEDYGTLSSPFNETTYPYGTIEVSGSAVTELGIQFIHIASGSAEFSGTKVEKSTLSEIGSGSVVVSGSAVQNSSPSYYGSGTLSAITGAAEVFGANPPDSTVLFEISGTTDQSSAFREIGSGTAEFSGTKVEKSIFSEVGSGSGVISGTKFENNTFSEIGSGSFSAITGAAEVAGVNPPDQTLLFEISGTTDQSSTFSQVVSGSAEFSGTKVEKSIFSEVGSGSGVISGTKFENNTFSEIGSGFFSAITGAAEVFSANPPDSTVLFNVSGTTDQSSTFSQVVSGSAEFSGTKVEKNTFREIGSGTFSAFFGSAESTLVNPPDQTLLFEISGTKVEKNTYSYNERSIFVFDGIDDYGLVSNAIDETIEDYGLISNGIDEEILDYGTISSPYNETTYPFGTIEVSGSAETELAIQFIHIASGTAVFSGTAFDKFKPNYKATGSFSAITGAAEATGVNPPDQTLLFEISGTKVEKNTYSYNERSILPAQSPDNYGLITDAVDESIDYGSITDSELESVSDYRYIYNTEDVYPYGTIEVSGSAITEPILLYVHRAEGSATFSGSAAESFTPATEIGSGSFSAFSGSAEVVGVNPPDSTVLFEISGGYTNLKATYSYNERSIFIFDGYEDHGVITAIQEYDDYGLLTDDVVYEDNGTLSTPFNETVYPFGTVELSGAVSNFKASFAHEGTGTAVFSGSAPQSFTPETEIGSGSAEFSGSARESFNPATAIGSGSFSAFGDRAEVFGANPPDSTVLFDITGSKIEKSTFREIGSGTAVFSGSAPQSFIPATEIGSGSFSAFSGSAESTLVNPPDSTVLFELSGTKVEKSTFREIGSGSATFSGASVSELQAIFTSAGTIQISGTKVEKNTFREIGSGSFSAFSGAAEVAGVNPPDQTLLFEISGTKVEKSTFREIGSGSATFSGTATARKNPGWFGRGTIEASGTTDDSTTFREIGSGSAEISGTATESFTPATAIGSGSIIISGAMTQNVQVYVPHITGSGSAEFSGDAIGAVEVLAIHTGGGFVTLSGSAAESFTPATEIGSGSFSAIIGSAESTLVNPPDSTVLFEISGGYTNLKATYVHEGSGSITISGSAIEKSLPSHYGSGTLSAITGAAESTSSNPPDSTVLFNISGSATESFTPATEIGSGIFNAFGGHAEVFGANPPENTVLFDISGSKVEKNTFREIGSGSATFSGASTDRIAPSNVSTGSAEFSGTKVEKNTFREIGYGSFSAIVGSVESVGANPPENTVLFELSGSKVEKSTFREIGSGSATFSGTMTQNVQVYVPHITGSGIVSITGTAADKFRPNYRATGTIAILGSGKESYSPATEIGGGNIDISGIGIGTYVIARNPYVFVTII